MLNRHALSRSLEPVEESKERNGGTELVGELKFGCSLAWRLFLKSSLVEFMRKVR